MSISSIIKKQLIKPEIIKRAEELGLKEITLDEKEAYANTFSRMGQCITFHFTFGDFPGDLIINHQETPGSCALTEVHHIELNPLEDWGTRFRFDRKGIGTFLFGIFMDAFRYQARTLESRSGLLFASTTEIQPSGEALLRKAGWKETVRFRNPNSRKKMIFWTYKLTTDEYDVAEMRRKY